MEQPQRKTSLEKALEQGQREVARYNAEELRMQQRAGQEGNEQLRKHVRQRSRGRRG